MIASSLGGYLAGRLRSSWTGVRSDEVYFRDTAHGFVAWALASVLGAAVLASPASSLIGGTAAGATQGAVSAAQSSGPMDGYVDTLLRTDPAASTAANNQSDARGEVLRLFTRSFRGGGDLAPDREYAAKVVAARTGLSQADADKRSQRSRHPGESRRRRGPQGHCRRRVLADCIASARRFLQPRGDRRRRPARRYLETSSFMKGKQLCPSCFGFSES